MTPLNPFLQRVKDSMQKPAPEAPADALLIAAAEAAREEIETINKNLKLKFFQLVEAPLSVRTNLDKKIGDMTAEVARLQEAIVEGKEQFIESETKWIAGQKSYEAIKEYYRPQLLSLEAQADYVPLAQRATVSRRKKKPRQQTNDN